MAGSSIRHDELVKRCFVLMGVALMIRTLCAVIATFVDYLPPNFDRGFLLGRAAYFWGWYSTAFYAHIFSGPLALSCGLLLMNNRLRTRRPLIHRWLGRLQALNIVLVLVPSGLWMSMYAETGVIAGLGLATLALATGWTMVQSVWNVVRRRIATHRVWSMRCFVLLCSAVVQRIAGGLATVAAIDGAWSYQLSSWLSWLLPMLIFEWARRPTHIPQHVKTLRVSRHQQSY